MDRPRRLEHCRNKETEENGDELDLTYSKAEKQYAAYLEERLPVSNRDHDDCGQESRRANGLDAIAIKRAARRSEKLR